MPFFTNSVESTIFVLAFRRVSQLADFPLLDPTMKAMDDDAQRDAWVSLRQLTQQMPVRKRKDWLLEAAAVAGWDGVHEGLDFLLADAVDSSSPPEAAIPKYGEVRHWLADRVRCAHESYWVRFALRRYGVRTHWKEIFLDAITVNDVIQLANTYPQLESWLASVYSFESPPDLLEVVPPLEHTQLASIRRSVDKQSKKLLRHPKWQSTEVAANEDAIAPSPPEFAAIEAKLLLAELSEPEKQVLYLRFFEGFTLSEVAGQLEVSIATAHRMVLAALRKAYRILGDVDERHSSD